MSEHAVFATPATPMDAIKQVYELFQDPTRFLKRDWAKNSEHLSVKTNDTDACCWCLGGAIIRVYNVDIVYKSYWIKELPERLKDTFKLLWEKIPVNSKIDVLCSWDYIDDIAQFNDKFGYTGVMRLLQAVIDDTEYTQEA